MRLSFQTFPTLVQNMAATVQGSCAQLLDFTVGSVVRAIIEAGASVALWLQWLILLVMQTTRAVTSNGSDLDSWMADFSLARLPAVAATGLVTFSRFSPTQAALIQPGAQVRTADGTQLFTVTTDTTNAAWNAAQAGYVLAAGTASVTVPVAAQNAGSQGNVQANTITLLASAIPYVDTVTNAAAFVSGIDAESDAALRTRFANYIQTRSRATPAAIGAAVQSVQQGLTYAIAETPGSFTVTVNDGTGSPSGTLLAAVNAAIAAYRPVGTTFYVAAPTDLTANVSLTITVSSAGVKANLLGPVASAISAFISALPIGAPLPFSRLAALAYAVDPSITNVSAVTLNGGTADLVPSAAQTVIPGTIAVS